MPYTSAAILVVGAIAHFLACLHLYGRRGFPEPDPALLSLVWMWVPPIVLTAIICRYDRRRDLTLVCYAIATSFAVSWATVMIVPSFKSAIGALSGMIVFAPMQLIAVFVVEAIVRLPFRFIRSFLSQPRCESCGYPLHGLTEARCPECGVVFAEALLEFAHGIAVQTSRWRYTTCMVILVLSGTAIFPFAYRAVSFNAAMENGRQLALRDWEQGSATCYFTKAEVTGLTPAQEDKYVKLCYNGHGQTGHHVREMDSYWQFHKHQTRNREVIERLLDEVGLDPPSLD